MSEPKSIRAGDSVSWSREVPGYPPSDGWTLIYRLLWATGTAVEFNATPSGEFYTVSLSSADTVAYAQGSATLLARVERTVTVLERVTLEQQPVTILPDLSAATTFDGRSSAEKALEDAKTALNAYVARGQGHVMEYEIAHIRMKFRSSGEIFALINRLKAEVNKERAARALAEGLGMPPGRVFVRM